MSEAWWCPQYLLISTGRDYQLALNWKRGPVDSNPTRFKQTLYNANILLQTLPLTAMTDSIRLRQAFTILAPLARCLICQLPNSRCHQSGDHERIQSTTFILLRGPARGKSFTKSMPGFVEGVSSQRRSQVPLVLPITVILTLTC